MRKLALLLMVTVLFVTGCDVVEQLDLDSLLVTITPEVVEPTVTAESTPTGTAEPTVEPTATLYACVDEVKLSECVAEACNVRMRRELVPDAVAFSVPQYVQFQSSVTCGKWLGNGDFWIYSERFIWEPVP